MYINICSMYAWISMKELTKKNEKNCKVRRNIRKIM